MNAGSSVANAADVTQTNGAWSTVTNIFTAASGTPFSGVTANVDYASIYPDGTTSGAVYVALITAVGGGGLTITLSSTIKYGTAPTTGATGISCKVNGAWADETALVQLGSGTVPQSTKVNWKAATYTVTASRTVALNGTDTKPLWFSGYNTTPGDLDNDTTNALSKPVLAFNSTFALATSGAQQIWSAFSVTGSASNQIWNLTGAFTHVLRCRCENTSSNAGALAFRINTVSTITFAYCWAKLPATATANGVFQTSLTGNSNLVCIGCVAEGGGNSGFCQTAGPGALNCLNCVALNTTGHGFLATTPTVVQLVGCTAYNTTGDGIRITAAPSTTADCSYIIGCLLVLCGGWGINQSGTATNTILRSANDFYSCTSGNENGFGDSPAFFGQTESVSPVTSSTDMTPVAGLNAINNGGAGVVENKSFSTYQSIGAVQPRVVALPTGVISQSAVAIQRIKSGGLGNPDFIS